MTTSDLVELTVREEVAWLCLNNPPLNILTRQVLDALARALDRLEALPAVRAVVLYGAGERAFSAGADITELAALTPTAAYHFARQGQILCDRLAAQPRPVIAALHGACLGGGAELALACHLRVAAENLRLGLPEVTLGLIPGFGGTQRLPRLVGPGRALALLLTGERLTAAEAHQAGLVQTVVPPADLLPTAEQLARRLAALSRPALRALLTVVHQGWEQPLSRGLLLEAHHFAALAGSPDWTEGLQAFRERRPPRFTAP